MTRTRLLAAALLGLPGLAAAQPGRCPASFEAGGPVFLTCMCAPEDIGAAAVWGSGPFAMGSAICPAARFAGAIDASGGVVRLDTLPGLSAYAAGSANGITTRALGATPGSFSVSAPSAPLAFADLIAPLAPLAPPVERVPEEPPLAVVPLAPPVAVVVLPPPVIAAPVPPVVVAAPPLAPLAPPVQRVPAEPPITVVPLAPPVAVVVLPPPVIAAPVPPVVVAAPPPPPLGLPVERVPEEPPLAVVPPAPVAAPPVPVPFAFPPPPAPFVAPAPVPATLRATGRLLLGVTFRTGSAELDPASLDGLLRLRDELRADPALRVRLVGHTDSLGGSITNQTLSERRAAAVAAWLVREGIAPARLVAQGRGEAEPLADNATAEGRARNRRVEALRID